MTTRRGFFKSVVGVGALVAATGQTKAPTPAGVPLEGAAVVTPQGDLWLRAGSPAWQEWQCELMQARSTIAGLRARVSLLDQSRMRLLERVNAQQSALDGNYL
jgi:hypothetical protein